MKEIVFSVKGERVESRYLIISAINEEDAVKQFKCRYPDHNQNITAEAVPSPISNLSYAHINETI